MARKFIANKIKQQKIPHSALPYFNSLLGKKTSKGANHPIFGTLEHIASNYKIIREHDKKFENTSIRERLDASLAEMKSLGYDIQMNVDGKSLFVNSESKTIIIFKSDFEFITDIGIDSAVYISVVSSDPYFFVKTFYENGIYALRAQESGLITKFVIVPDNNIPTALIAVGSHEDYLSTQNARKRISESQ
ncbi:hypothetical protein LMH73_007415 [Vibrio splendidus]|nr:hypothetical protein [Vibrio splendidus]MCC4883128.1 hypothetical protein [Vibrio splendidus]